MSHSSQLKRCDVAYILFYLFVYLFSGPITVGTIDSEAMTSEQKESFWETLQEEWEKMARDDDLVEHPWLTDFNSTAFQPYQV